jgi:hypothetical protein
MKRQVEPFDVLPAAPKYYENTPNIHLIVPNIQRGFCTLRVDVPFEVIFYVIHNL